MQVRRPPLVTYNAETGGVTIRPPTSLLQSLGSHVDKFIQGNTGVPFFDCIGVRDAPPLNRFVSLASKDIESLSRHFLSYLQVCARCALPEAGVWSAVGSSISEQMAHLVVADKQWPSHRISDRQSVQQRRSTHQR